VLPVLSVWDASVEVLLLEDDAVSVVVVELLPQPDSMETTIAVVRPSARNLLLFFILFPPFCDHKWSFYM
jgi:hypothetical protein